MVWWGWKQRGPRMVIRKGSIYWVDFSPGKGSEPIGRRPGLVIQNDLLNDSNINTVIMLAITSTLKFGELPGNVILRKGEANLSKKCVVNITQIKSVDKKSIKEKIGTLSKKRMDEVHEGLKIVMSLPWKRSDRSPFFYLCTKHAVHERALLLSNNRSQRISSYSLFKVWPLYQYVAFYFPKLFWNVPFRLK